MNNDEIEHNREHAVSKIAAALKFLTSVVEVSSYCAVCSERVHEIFDGTHSGKTIMKYFDGRDGRACRIFSKE